MRKPTVLLACNFTHVLPDAFSSAGWDVLCADIVPAEHDHQHYQGNVLDLSAQVFDLVIACPPCTYLSVAGADLWKYRGAKIQQAFEFVLAIYNFNSPRVCIENPVGWMNSNWRAPDQILHPWEFGDPYWKRTCFWLRGLPPLVCGPYAVPRQRWLNKFHHGRPSARFRSMFFPGVANAMAQQWSPDFLSIPLIH